MKRAIKVITLLPTSPRKWGLASSSKKLSLVVLLLMVMGVLVLNLETVFRSGYYGSEMSSDSSSSSSSRHHLFHSHDLLWPTASYFMMSEEEQEQHQRRSSSRSSSEHRFPGKLGNADEEVFSCDRSHLRTDVCHMKGDVRMHSETASFILYARNGSRVSVGEEKIKPYTRKWEKNCMDLVHEVTLKSLPMQQEEEEEQDSQGVHHNNHSSSSSSTPTPTPTSTSTTTDRKKCDVRHSVPAVVFTTGGYTGNVYHEFHDGLVPLYITSQHLKGEVVFIVVEFHEWWLTKYEDVISQLSNYPVIDFDNDHRIHCFPEVTVGLHIHDELAIRPSLMPHNETIVDFRNVLDAAYTKFSSSSSADITISVDNNDANATNSSTAAIIRQPRLIIIARNDTRLILNLKEVVELAQEVGFQVEICKPDRTSELKKIYWALNSSDVLLGVHGAAMTHFLFMRPGSVFIQVVPLGTKWAAAAYYGEPALKLGLQYIEYEITAEESSLSDKYDKNDIVLTDPAQVIDQGWWVVKEIYLEKQDVRLSLPRFKKTLLDAKAKALAFLNASSTSSS